MKKHQGNHSRGAVEINMAVCREKALGSGPGKRTMKVQEVLEEREKTLERN